MNIASRFGSVKAMVAKVLTVGFLAGAVVMFAPAKAQAQEIFIGHGYHARRGFYERPRVEAFRRHDAFLHEREFRRYHRERFYGYR